MRGAWVALFALGALGAALPAAGEALPGAPEMAPALAKRLAEAAAKRPPEEVRTRHRREDGSPRFTNRLVLEQSPYLLQHAHNPVDWHPWGEEAFALAKRLGRPVFVSIGYSTCHWCHVMEDESFDDLETAKRMNESYVSIKVDREVRPDVDATYMAAIHALGRRGGWPLNVWLTPEREPFYAGTYFPPTDRRGLPGFPRVLEAVAKLYREQPDEVVREAARVAAAVRAELTTAEATGEGAPPPRALLMQAKQGLARAYDDEEGGLGRDAKFPGALPVPLLLRVHRNSGDAEALEMVVHTLERMAKSGLRDHIGGGFHRYATDRRWRIPHFEKMLYDQALLIGAYLEAWQVSGRAEFAEVARETALALRRDFEAPEGGFYSASDADSAGPGDEHGEGFYFTWTAEELDRALGEDDAALARALWGVGDEPLLEGRSVLYAARSPGAVAAALDLDEGALPARIAAIRARLAAARAERPAPLVDRKILTAWNALAISALARAGFALDAPELVASASRAMARLLATRDDAGRLRRVRFGGEVSGVAFLEDYALAIAALLDLYESEALADPTRLADALALQQRLDADHGDAAGGYFRTASHAESPLAREKPFAEAGTLPSGNGVAALNLLRLAALTGDEALGARAERVLGAFAERLTASPSSAPSLLLALDWWHDLQREVIVVLPEQGGDARPLRDVLRRVHQPNRVLAVVREGDSLRRNAELVSLVSGKKAMKGRPTAYVCENRTCRFPTGDPVELERQLREAPLQPGASP